VEEIGRAGWVAIGVAGMALVGVAHAVAGAGRIAREAVHARAAEGRDPEAGGSDSGGSVISGPGGWILFSALVLAGGAIHHAAAGAGAIVKQILPVAAR
jgi:hypothetical protein